MRLIAVALAACVWSAAAAAPERRILNCPVRDGVTFDDCDLGGYVGRIVLTVAPPSIREVFDDHKGLTNALRSGSADATSGAITEHTNRVRAALAAILTNLLLVLLEVAGILPTVAAIITNLLRVLLDRFLTFRWCVERRFVRIPNQLSAIPTYPLYVDLLCANHLC